MEPDNVYFLFILKNGEKLAESKPWEAGNRQRLSSLVIGIEQGLRVAGYRNSPVEPLGRRLMINEENSILIVLISHPDWLKEE